MRYVCIKRQHRKDEKRTGKGDKYGKETDGSAFINAVCVEYGAVTFATESGILPLNNTLTPEATPSIAIDYADRQLTGFEVDKIYYITIVDGSRTDATANAEGKLNIHLDWFGMALLLPMAVRIAY